MPTGLVSYLLTMVSLSGYLALCWAIGEVARRRDRSQALFTIGSFFATPLIGYLVLALVTAGGRTEDTRQGRLVRCPACAEWIQAAAIKCRYCGEVFQRPAAPAMKPAAAAPIQNAAGAPQMPKAAPALEIVRPPVSKPAAVRPVPIETEAAKPEAVAQAQPPAATEQLATPPSPIPAPSLPEETPADRAAVELAERIDGMRHVPADQHPPGFYEETKGWLHHDAAGVREAAARFLGRHCRQHSDAEVLLRMVTGDPDVEVRVAAAECLGGIFRNSRNREANEVLAEVTRNREEEGAVRAAALAAIKRINSH